VEEWEDKNRNIKKAYPTGRTARLPPPRPVGLEPPRVGAPGPSRAGTGLGALVPAWRAPGLALLRPASPFSEAAARPRVSGPDAWGLARLLSLGTGGGRGASWLALGAGGVSARGRRDPLGPSSGASVRGASTSPRGGPSRIRSRRDAIPSESSLSSSSSSSSLGDSSSGSPLCLDLARRASNAWRSRFFFFSPFFAESFADFSFSADWRRLSRSTSSSFTGGLEDRTSIRPCQN
jgi:hypothetical protein